MSTRPRFLRLSMALALLVAAGCSLVNTFEDVAPRTDGVYVQADATVIDVAAPSEASTDATTDASDGGTGSGGAIVVGGRVEEDGGLKYVLAVLDPANGREIAKRENMVVAAIQYDGVRDLWFIFESKSTDFVPGRNDQVVLHVRNLDAKTGVWTERVNKVVPTLQSYDSIGVTNQRITYIAYEDPEAGQGYEYVTYDTTDPANPTQMNRIPVTGDLPLGGMASRSTTGAGGVVNFVRINRSDCTGPTTCQLELVPVLVPPVNEPALSAAAPIGYMSAFAIPGYAAMPPPADIDLVVFPRSGNDASAPATVRRYDPRLRSEQQTASQFVITDNGIKRGAVSSCQNVAFFVGTNGDLRVHAVPIKADGTGTPTNASTGHSGQSVYFEPSSKTVLAPFAQGAGFDFSAFKLGGTTDAPTLAKRGTDWTPPADLRPILLGIRETLPITCN